ncbi:MAG: InlB B-repeat-containing protein [Gammaproteobacteria bacterium]
MKRIFHLPSLVAALVYCASDAIAGTEFSNLTSFDVINDTNVPAYGFEIELDDIHSTDITYTDWQAYGAPDISEDNTDPAHPKVFIRYASNKDPVTGVFSTFTSVAGWEHFGFGHYASPTAVKYHWLIENPSAPGVLIAGPAVDLATPIWTYTPAQPDVAQPAQVVAKISAPPPQAALPLAAFGDAVWVKAFKTTTHNNNFIELINLVSEDPADPTLLNWKNGEPAEVEVEWKLMQDEFAVPNGVNDYLIGNPEDLPIGDETITRRYEFYKYIGPLDSVSRQAQCDQLPPIDPAIDPSASTECFTLGEAGLKGGYIGAQMAAFNVKAPLGITDWVLYGQIHQPFPARSIIAGGNKPYTINISGSLPAGMILDPNIGVLSGTPTTAGPFHFMIDATDADGNQLSHFAYVIIDDPATPDSKYPLSVNITGTGWGEVDSDGNIHCGSGSCSEDIYSGSTVTLTATPFEGSQFTGWSGDACGGSTATACQVTMDAAKTVNAEFTLQQYSVSVGKSGSGSGTVSGNVIDCGDVCSATLDYGSSVTLTATPSNGSAFTGWSGACSGTGPCNLTVATANNNVIALFTAQYLLSVNKSGSGSGTVSGSGIDCGSTCSAGLNDGTTVSLTATPAIGSTFAGWSGACSGAGACNVTMDGAKNVTATFTLQQFTLSVGKSGTGSGTVAGNGIDCGSTCSSTLDYGTAVSLIAVPDAYSEFTGWSGACNGTDTCNVSMDAAKNVTATFTLKTYALSVTKTGDGTVTGGSIDCGATCSTVMTAGSTITLTATPAAGNEFVEWSGDCAGSSSTCTVTMESAKTATATFVPITYTLSVAKINGSYGSVSSSPAGINCGTTCSSQYNQDTPVVLTATAVKKHRFTGWTGACAGTSATCTVTMTQSQNVTAKFK